MAGLELVNEGDKTYSQKLNLAYIDAKSKEDATAYLNYNDVAKASMNLLTMEALLSRMQKDGNNENSQDLSYLAKIFDFVFDSEIVKAVQKGRYEIVADEIEKINVSANKIVLGLKLDKLGFGSSSRIDIVFDGKKDAPISEITLSGIKAKNFALDGTIKVNTYFYQEMDTQGYYRMDHLPDVFDQVSDLISSKQATLGLEGSVLNENQCGVRLNGETSFDANLKNATYTDFSGVTDLAEYMLNTATKLDTYHLKSSVSVILWTADIITIDADLYISIQEEGKVNLLSRNNEILQRNRFDVSNNFIGGFTIFVCLGFICVSKSNNDIKIAFKSK